MTRYVVEITDEARTGSAWIEVDATDNVDAMRSALYWGEDELGVSDQPLRLDARLISVPVEYRAQDRTPCVVCGTLIPAGFSLCSKACHDEHNEAAEPEARLLVGDVVPTKGVWQVEFRANENGYRACLMERVGPDERSRVIRVDDLMYPDPEPALSRAQALEHGRVETTS